MIIILRNSILTEFALLFNGIFRVPFGSGTLEVYTLFKNAHKISDSELCIKSEMLFNSLKDKRNKKLKNAHFIKKTKIF